MLYECMAVLLNRAKNTATQPMGESMLLGFVDKAIIPLSPSNSAITIGTQTF